MSLLIHHLQSGQPVPEVLAEWFANGAMRAMAGRASSLDHALGLTSHGRHTLHCRIKRREVRRRLLVALDLAGSHAALAKAIEHFRARKWPCWRHLEQPPKRASRIERELFQAFRVSGGNVPESIRSLKRIEAQAAASRAHD
ncbi:MAG TPA: hypothetical protein ENJ86_11495 [Methylothermaceae bacterium]|nr:hypothetical protein [Methylothermaceae bacterium]